jgi:hypothetical protein
VALLGSPELLDLAVALFARVVGAELSFEAQVPLVKLGAVLAPFAASDVVPNPATFRAKQTGILTLEAKLRAALLCRVGVVIETRLPRPTAICIENVGRSVIGADYYLFADPYRAGSGMRRYRSSSFRQCSEGMWRSGYNHASSAAAM